MRILVVNPNTTASMTAKIAAAARAVAREGTEIVATQPADGPASIEGFYDGALAVPGVLREIAAHPEAEAIVLGCAGMSNLMDRLSAEHGVPVLDGVACATTLAEAILSCGLKASKSGGYAPSRHYCDLPQLSS